MLIFAAAALMSLGLTVADATTSVQNVKVQQRYPWNGLVDIDYEIVSDSPDTTDFYVYLTAMDNDLNHSIAPRTLTGDGAARVPVKKGVHRVTWNMGADEPGIHSSALSVSVHASTAIPYLVIDLSGGPDAATYPVRYSATPPNLNDDTCRTTELWLKFIQPGTFMMGSPTDEAGRNANETQHQVTLTRPYYIGIFQITRAQWKLIKGNDDNIVTGQLSPRWGVSYNMIRGSLNGSAWPTNGQVDEGSWIGMLRKRTSLAIDLPTEAQWEYACRAGSSTRFSNGDKDADLNLIGRFNGNSNDVKGKTDLLLAGGGGSVGYPIAKVGSYIPNAWSLYDMHGNVMEWCLDAGGYASYNSQLGSVYAYSSEAVVEPAGLSTISISAIGRIVRGGFGQSGANDCRSASRACAPPQSLDATWNNSQTGIFGFRVVVLPAVLE